MKTSLIDKRDTNYLPLFMVVILGAQGFISLCILGLWLSFHRLSKKQLAYVQTETGETYQVKAIDAKARTPETIRRFVTQILYLTFNWSGEVTGAEGKGTPDTGIEITIDGERVRVPSAAVYASYAFSLDLQQPLLKKISKIVPSGVFSGSTTAILTLDHVSPPKELAPGRWQVLVVGHHQIGSALPGRLVPFTKRILVEAITVPVVPEGDTPVERSIYNLRHSGLQIVGMEELNQESNYE